MSEYTIEDAWDALIESGISEETLQIVTSINGYTMDTCPTEACLMLLIIRATAG